MKLIIDIDNDYFEIIKYRVEHGDDYKPYTLIANGKPFDNAPTVDIKDQIAGAYNEGYMCGNREAEKTRPQGEWVYGEDDCGQDGWFCSECNFFVPWYYQYYEKDVDFIRDYKVCPHCIAEMVTYTGKDRDMKGGAE